MVRDVELDERSKRLKKSSGVIKFVNPDDLLPEMLTDPDYRLKFLQRQYGGMNSVSCSKCHHCR